MDVWEWKKCVCVFGLACTLMSVIFVSRGLAVVLLHDPLSQLAPLMIKDLAPRALFTSWHVVLLAGYFLMGLLLLYSFLSLLWCTADFLGFACVGHNITKSHFLRHLDRIFWFKGPNCYFATSPYENFFYDKGASLPLYARLLLCAAVGWNARADAAALREACFASGSGASNPTCRASDCSLKAGPKPRFSGHRSLLVAG